MELYQLRAFVMVAEEGNVTRAAERLFTSQPAVSAQIRALESEFGIDLFLRTPSGMKLTADGSQLLDQARKLISEATSLETLAGHLRDGTSGTLRIGVNHGPDLRIEQITAALSTQFPDLSIAFDYGASGELLKLIRKYEIDVTFFEGSVGSNNDEHIHHERIGTTHLRIVIPAAWKDDLPEGDWESLQRYPWIFASPQCSYSKLFDQICEQRSIKLQPQFRVDNDGTAYNFVRRGMGISILPIAHAAAAESDGDAVVWPGFEAQVPQQVGALARRMEEPAVRAFFDACVEAYPAAKQIALKPQRKQARPLATGSAPPVGPANN